MAPPTSARPNVIDIPSRVTSPSTLIFPPRKRPCPLSRAAQALSSPHAPKSMGLCTIVVQRLASTFHVQYFVASQSLFFNMEGQIAEGHKGFGSLLVGVVLSTAQLS